MLLEYNVDTIDEKMVPRAIELRKRVAARKLNQSIEEGDIDADTLLEIKERNRDERKAHTTESFEITDAGIKGRVALARAEQQLNVEGKVRLLGRDVSRASRLSKSRIDALTDLERRISTMRNQLKDPSKQPIESIVNQELRINNKLKLEREFAQCPKCHRRIVVELLETHERMCQFVNGVEIDQHDLKPPIYSIDQDVITSIATFPPQPPRHCKVIAKGATFIHWQWEPPVIDGGLTITEYEMSYMIKITEFDKDQNKYKKWSVEVPSLKTSQWMFIDNPVCNHGYKMVSLRSGAEYTNFKIRCYNLRGWSEWVDMIQLSDETQHGGTTLNTGYSVFTNEPEAPSAPLFFNCTKVTSSCIHINWRPPYYDGGSDIVDYMIHYTVLERHVTVTDRDVIVEKVNKYNTENTELNTIIRHIMSDSDVTYVAVCAINKVGLVGERAVLKPLPVVKDEKPVYNTKKSPKKESNSNVITRTLKCSRYSQLRREMDLATNTAEHFVDSAFFTGVKQRFNRVEYMKKVQEELAVTDPDPLELEEAKEWEAVKEIQRIKKEQAEEAMRLAQELAQMDQFNYGEHGDNKGDELASFSFTFRQRRQHFKRKIESLEKYMEDLKKERQDIDRARLIGTSDMKNKEKRLLEFKLEMERLKHYTGNSITSSVLTGVDMQYKVLDYRHRVDKAYDVLIQEIANIKFKVMSGESRKQKIKLEIEKSEESRQDRIAKFKEFDLNYQKTLRAMERLSTLGSGSSEKILSYYFNQLKSHMNDRKWQRQRVTDLFLKVIFRYKKSAFKKWCSGKFLVTSNDKDQFISAGGVLLQQAEEKRVELQGLLRQAIAETNVIKQKLFITTLPRDTKKKLTTSKEFKNMEEGMDAQTMHFRGMHFLYEGDGYAKENKFILAKEMYEAQIIWIRARPKLEIKLLSICHGRLGKMFLKLGKNNRAIVEFDRQLSLAKEIRDKPEEADAYYGLGTGYLNSFDYDNAIRYLNVAQGLLDALGNGPKYCGCLHGLKECYFRLAKHDQVAMYEEKIIQVENELQNKISLLSFRLDDMKTRLSTTAAEIEYIVKIERTTYKALKLRQKIDIYHQELEILENQLQEQDEVVEGVEKLLDAIKKEMHDAIETDEPNMWSELVHETPQVVEIEELKQRLQVRSKVEYERMLVEKEASRKISVQIKNKESNIEEADQQLLLEDGALMKHSRHDKPFRLVSLCAANAAGNEVTGTATGGIEEFIAAEGSNIHVLDYHSGALMHVYTNEDPDPTLHGHDGVITCLLHDGKLIFTGSTDESIISWNSETKQKVNTFLGHEGSIVSMATEETLLVSGASDATLRLWNKTTAEQVRVIFGHSKSVLSMEIGSTWLLTGSADHEVRVWKVHKKSKHTVNVDCTYRLMGHDCAITCVRYGKMEVLSGDVKGRIFIWWMSTGKILRQCQVHVGPVKCMQFDSVHIVSGGVDHSVCITDIATGEVLQNLRGHEGHILALAFDTERIISVSGDNTVRYWQWGNKSGPQDKFHVLNKGETLLQVSKLYSVTVANIMKWNGIIESKQCFVGMKLLVRKGDPNSYTEAEKFNIERDRRRAGGMLLTSKKLKEQAALMGDSMPQYDRIHRLATDIDFYSMGNRLFGREKRQFELFPDHIDPNVNKNSLASRLQRTQQDMLHVHKSKLQPRYFISSDNEDEWGDIADELALAMLSLMVEYESYSLVMEQKRELRSTQSVIGRVNTYQRLLAAQDLEKEKQEKERISKEKSSSSNNAQVDITHDSTGIDNNNSQQQLLLLSPIKEGQEDEDEREVFVGANIDSNNDGNDSNNKNNMMNSNHNNNNSSNNNQVEESNNNSNSPNKKDQKKRKKHKDTITSTGNDSDVNNNIEIEHHIEDVDAEINEIKSQKKKTEGNNNTLPRLTSKPDLITNEQQQGVTAIRNSTSNKKESKSVKFPPIV